MQVAEAGKRLGELRAGSKLVSPAERAALEKAFATAVSHWSKRRRIFRAIWCACQALPLRHLTWLYALTQEQWTESSFQALLADKNVSACGAGRTMPHSTPGHVQPAASTCACWRRDQVSENIDLNTRELWEDIGVETDEAAGTDLAALQQLLPAKRARH